MASRHSWEDPDPAAPAAKTHPWELPTGDAEEACIDSDSEDESPMPMDSQAAASKKLLEILRGLYLESVISAKVFCNMCFFAERAGVRNDEISEYAVKPGLGSGNYQKHLNRAFGFDDLLQRFYELPVAGVSKDAIGRADKTLTLAPPHEILNTEIAAEAGIGFKLHEAIATNQLPPAYTEHPVVQGSETPVIPVALYMDSVPYSQTDSVIGIWLISMLTGTRYMIGVVRKRVLCQCGCRGRDTFHPILSFLRWSLRCCAEGKYPDCRHDGSPFTATDAQRAALAGRPLQFKAAVVHLKGDWVEFCERYGFPTYASSLRPCFCCAAAPGAEMYSPVGVSMVETVWHNNTAED